MHYNIDGSVWLQWWGMISHLIFEVTVDTIIMSLKNLNSRLNSLVIVLEGITWQCNWKPVNQCHYCCCHMAFAELNFYNYFVAVLFHICIVVAFSFMIVWLSLWNILCFFIKFSSAKIIYIVSSQNWLGICQTFTCRHHDLRQFGVELVSWRCFYSAWKNFCKKKNGSGITLSISVNLTTLLSKYATRKQLFCNCFVWLNFHLEMFSHKI